MSQPLGASNQKNQNSNSKVKAKDIDDEEWNELKQKEMGMVDRVYETILKTPNDPKICRQCRKQIQYGHDFITFYENATEHIVYFKHLCCHRPDAIDLALSDDDNDDDNNSYPE